MPRMVGTNNEAIRILLDTRRIWIDDQLTKEKTSYSAEDHKMDVSTFERLSAFEVGLLKAHEQEAVRKFYHVKDKKMCLASYLLKYHVISRSCDIPWSDVNIISNRPGKPFHQPKNPEDRSVDFNVSHQAGIVVAVTHLGFSVKVGVDIVCVNERNDLARIAETGFDVWVDMFADIFSDHEMNEIVNSAIDVQLEDGTEVSAVELGHLCRCCVRNIALEVTLTTGEKKNFDSDVIIEAKLRRFFAYWCLKEAYVKMTGDALLADWLRELEFRNVRAPRSQRRLETAPGTAWGESIRDVEVMVKGKPKDVQIELHAFEDQYLIATVTEIPLSNGLATTDRYPEFGIADLKRDILPQRTGLGKG